MKVGPYLILPWDNRTEVDLEQLGTMVVDNPIDSLVGTDMNSQTGERPLVVWDQPAEDWMTDREKGEPLAGHWSRMDCSLWPCSAASWGSEADSDSTTFFLRKSTIHHTNNLA